MTKIKNAVIKNYFDYFNSKNIEELSKLFSNEISVTDWETSIRGKQNVLKFYKNLFINFPRINVEVVNIINSKKIVFAELLIKLNENQRLHVVDIIELDVKLNIIKIRAFKR